MAAKWNELKPIKPCLLYQAERNKSMVIDITSLLDREYSEAEKYEQSCPVCDGCGDHILDEDCYVIGDEIFCPECIESFRTLTENYRNDV